MFRLTPTRRALFAAFAIVQMAVPAVVAFADADLALASGGVTQVHVEDHTGRNCRPAHPDDCALCRLLSHFSPQRGQAAILPRVAVVRPGLSADVAPLLSFIAGALARSRAPPVG
jgi:hypothetical protein